MSLSSPWESRFAWAGRPCRPTSPRAGSTPRPSLSEEHPCASRICPSKAWMVALALSGSSARSPRRRAVWPRSPLRWPPGWRPTTLTSASCGSSTTACPQASQSDRVVGELVNGSRHSLSASSDSLNQFDVAVIQHEYGLYGGADGDEVLEILGGLDIPSIVIAHTILTEPDATSAVRSQRGCCLGGPDGRHDGGGPGPTVRWLRRRCFQSDDHCPRCRDPARRVVPDRTGRPLILTWGLIGPGKGIERAIEAMRTLHDLPMRPRYLVAGRTHPKVLACPRRVVPS